MSEEKHSDTAKINCPTDKEYVEIIDSNISVDRAYLENEGQPAKILYYCQECKKPVTPKRIGNKLSFKCGECDKPAVSFGTENSITSYYNIK